ncbi:unnamed protein product [Notodromas monacha]|uniref:Uncharacterized protein n=1 Tax=Notodromas monacha TaxID=399045 RepID=A0A7R9BKH0_9CRUS|nr:unnamed protein product [Notodromas monacha]CAG0916903.1 unnamed protein product [Notodromas monacha]
MVMDSGNAPESLYSYDRKSWENVGNRVWVFRDEDDEDNSTQFRRTSFTDHPAIWGLLLAMGVMVLLGIATSVIISIVTKVRERKAAAEHEKQLKIRRQEVRDLREQLAKLLENDPEFQQALGVHKRAALMRSSSAEAATLIDAVAHRRSWEDTGEDHSKTMSYSERRQMIKYIRKNRREIVKELKFNLQANQTHAFSTRDSVSPGFILT